MEQTVAVGALMRRRLANDLTFERVGSRPGQSCECQDLLRHLTSALFRRKLPFTGAQATELITLATLGSPMRTFDDDLPALVKVARRLNNKGALEPELIRALQELANSFVSGAVWEDARRRKVRKEIAEICTEPVAISVSHPEENKSEPTPLLSSTASIRGWGGFPIRNDDPLRDFHLKLDEYLKQSAPTILNCLSIAPEKHAAGNELLSQTGEVAANIIRAGIARLRYWIQEEDRWLAEEAQKDFNRPPEQWLELLMAKSRRRLPKESPNDENRIAFPMALRPVLEKLLWAKPPMHSHDFESLVDFVADGDQEGITGVLSAWPLIRAIEHAATHSGLPPGLRRRLSDWSQNIQSRPRMGTDGRKLVANISFVLGESSTPVVQSGEAWSDACLADLKAMNRPAASDWLDLLRHCSKAESSKPTQKWLTQANTLMDALGRDRFKTITLRWFELVAKPRPIHREPPDTYSPDPDLLITEHNATVLRGLAWCCTGWKDADVSSALANLVEVCFKKVRQLGPRCPRVGNACLYALSVTSSEDAAAQLSRLDSTVKQPTARKRIGKSLDAAATLTGQTREDLEEKSVPTFGLGADETLTRSFGSCSATLRVVNSREVEISWFKDGKAVKSVPSEVKQNHPDELKQFQKLGKDIVKMLAAQRIRIERLLMSGREWSFEVWRQRYLDHRLLAGISRRLIWHFKHGERTALGTWRDGKLVDVHNLPLDWLAPETRVRLWHPIGFPVETVAAWREWIHAQEICQPFKQAHREVYLLTDAELRTGNYSNRFAAHLLGQHQFAALCTQRGWKYSLMGGFDSYSVPTLELPAWDMLAEYWVEGVGELAASGIALHLSTDQVRFVRAGEALPLTEVPATVFSEVMRDVDLFVGVGSIGNNPEWRDQGEIENAGNYWQSYSFGDLNASAKTRKEVLQRLLPKLKIATQCSFEEKFLVVKGSLRTYRIHLGSANIQMEPNNQYLCIVPDSRPLARNDDKVLLPFEGDRTLSLILSKAFLLADDAKIKDSSIVNQISR
ncbi:MAG TPA: DUF4132 domain-containing protein [Verrucomicrobiae bacterium]|nr:DUF4132 domain-containing protein [Verrucomicrobiae bacterium]